MEPHLPHDHGGHLEPTLEHIQDFQKVAEIFKMLGDSTRVRIFWLLCHGKQCVVNISALVGMSSPAVFHHLRQLKDGGLLQSTREGKEVFYQAADTPQARLLHYAIEEVMEIVCPDKQN